MPEASAADRGASRCPTRGHQLHTRRPGRACPRAGGAKPSARAERQTSGGTCAGTARAFTTCTLTNCATVSAWLPQDPARPHRAAAHRGAVAHRSGGRSGRHLRVVPRHRQLDVSDAYRRIWGFTPRRRSPTSCSSACSSRTTRLCGPGASAAAIARLCRGPHHPARPGEERWIARRGEIVDGDAQGRRRFVPAGAARQSG